MIKGVIFDLDGTLLDSMSIWDTAGERYLQGLGIFPEPELGKTLFTMSMEEGARYLRQQYGLSQDIPQIIEGINQTIQEFYEHQVTMKPGVLQLLEMLRTKEIPMVIATSSDRCLIDPALKRLGLHSYFMRVFTCSEIGVGKHQPDIFFKASLYLGIEIEKTWVFEDALYAVKTAKDAGYCVAAVEDGSDQEERDEIQRICDYYFKDFSDLIPFTERYL